MDFGKAKDIRLRISVIIGAKFAIEKLSHWVESYNCQLMIKPNKK